MNPSVVLTLTRSFTASLYISIDLAFSGENVEHVPVVVVPLPQPFGASTLPFIFAASSPPDMADHEGNFVRYSMELKVVACGS